MQRKLLIFSPDVEAFVPHSQAAVCRPSMLEMLSEITVNKGRPWMIAFRDGTTAELPAAVSIDDAVAAFGASSGTHHQYLPCLNPMF